MRRIEVEDPNGNPSQKRRKRLVRAPNAQNARMASQPPPWCSRTHPRPMLPFNVLSAPHLPLPCLHKCSVATPPVRVTSIRVGRLVLAAQCPCSMHSRHRRVEPFFHCFELKSVGGRDWRQAAHGSSATSGPPPAPPPAPSVAARGFWRVPFAFRPFPFLAIVVLLPTGP